VQTHAYVLSRRGMHRLYSHVTHERKVVFDWAAASLHGLEPHFYAPPILIVSQTCPDRGREKRK
jgi:hypothetical protein